MITLFITEIIELIIVFVFGFRNKKNLAAVFLVNLCTNPLLNYILQLNLSYSFFEANIFNLIFLEIIVIFIEWLLLAYALRKGLKKLFLVSVCMNTFSFFIGNFILKIIFKLS